MIEPVQGLAIRVTESRLHSAVKYVSISTGAGSKGSSTELHPARNLQAGQGLADGKDVSRASGLPENGQSSLCRKDTVDVIATYMSATPTTTAL